MGRINSKAGLKTAHKVFNEFGRSWEAVNKYAQYDPEKQIYKITADSRRRYQADQGAEKPKADESLSP